MVMGRRSSRITRSMLFTAPPRDSPGFRLNETVTDGNWPVWFTLNGPTVRCSFATASSGMSREPGGGDGEDDPLEESDEDDDEADEDVLADVVPEEEM